jgi:uncharacterized protein (TIGR04255 family)
MPLTLPDVDSTTLARSPLAVVVCQVRYEQNLVVSDGDTGLKIHEALGGREGPYPRIEPQQVMAAQFEFGPSGLSQFGSPGIPSRGWRYRSTDGAWTITVMPDFFSLETTAYTTWATDFRERLNSLLRTVGEFVRPSIEERSGLRYVNRISEAHRSQPVDWIGIVADEFLGPVASPIWSPGIVTYQQQLQLDISDGSRALIRHGLISSQDENIEGYLLDFDISRQEPQRFDPESILSAANGFNRTALTLFQRSLRDGYITKLREGGKP